MLDTVDIDQSLLHVAQTVRARLVGLESEAERTRQEYHQAIRRLHASGVSMRDIADALDLSHQRVHQIVNGGGQMASATSQRGLVRRLIRRTGRERTPGGKPGDPGGLLLERFYVDAREAMAHAQEEASALLHSYIGTEHLLLGLLRAEHGLAARLLASVGADLEHLRGSVETLLGRGEEAKAPPLPVTPRVKKVLELARQEAKRLHSPHIRSEHILLGLAREGGGLAARMLADLGVGYEHLRRRLDRAALACSFCGRSGLEAVHLIAGPNVYVCEHCVDEASRLVSDDSPGWSGGSLSIADEDQTTTCSFCGKRRAGGTRMISGPGARICTDCLILCREIEAEERTTLNLDRA
jgi:hypothetical protein